MAAEVRVEGDRLALGECHVVFQRTLRIPDDGDEYPLPPGLGAFPLRKVADHMATVPCEWRERGGAFLPMYQREALWLSFDGPYWKPHALKVGVGKVNAITGEAWDTPTSSRADRTTSSSLSSLGWTASTRGRGSSGNSSRWR